MKGTVIAFAMAVFCCLNVVIIIHSVSQRNCLTKIRGEVEDLNFDAEVIDHNITESVLYKGNATLIEFDEGNVSKRIFEADTQDIHKPYEEEGYYTTDYTNNLYINRDFLTYTTNSDLVRGVTSGFSLFSDN